MILGVEGNSYENFDSQSYISMSYIYDAERALNSFQYDNHHLKDPYPEFEIDQILIQKTYNIFTEIRNQSLKYMLDKHDHSVQDYGKLIENILKEN